MRRAAISVYNLAIGHITEWCVMPLLYAIYWLRLVLDDGTGASGGTGGLIDLQHGVSYLCSIDSIALKCTVVGIMDMEQTRQTNGETRTDGSHHCSMPPPKAGHNYC